jgi:hypothetical protein
MWYDILMKILFGLILCIVVAVVGFIGISFLLPQIAHAPNGTGGTTTTGQTVNIPDLVYIDTPTSNQKISSPVVLSGKARGSWYFEASFPIEILDASGKVIGQGQGQARSDWMTSNFVPFTAAIIFTSPGSGKTGIVRVKNDNPSGDPARDKHVDIPVTF